MNTLLKANQTRIFLIPFLILFFGSMGIGYAEIIHPTNLPKPAIEQTTQVFRETARQTVPQYVFGTAPVPIMTSWYDYFPGNYHSIPIRVQPSPSGNPDSGSICLVFQAAAFWGGTRRVYSVYLDNGEIIYGPELINPGSNPQEGFAGIDIDPVTGNPFVSWHVFDYGNPNHFNSFLSFDDYSSHGEPGFWITPYTVIDNPYDIGDDIDQQFIWPLVFIGPSPNPELRRLYVIVRNSTLNDQDYPSENPLIAFADFAHPTDITSYDPDQWSYVTIPQMNLWRDMNIRPYYAPIVSQKTGTVAFVGHTVQMGTTDPYHENNFLFVLENYNHGEGNWTLYTGDPTIPVDNPADFFCGSDNQPYQDMRYAPLFNRHNSVIDKEGNYHYLSLYALLAEDYTWFPNMTTTKHVRFNRAAEEFSISDVFPRNSDGSPYLPWNIPPDFDNGLIISHSWPCFWYFSGDLFSENYQRIIEQGSKMVGLFQSSKLSDGVIAPNLADSLKTHIMISGDYGETWSDPIILSSLDTLELAGINPTYWYMADQMEHLQDDWYRLHLFFYDMHDYGATIIIQPTGGTLMYTALDINFGSLNIEQETTIAYREQMLQPNYPNPFNPQTTIAFLLTTDTKVRLEVYNIKGQLVKCLVDDYKTAGEHLAVWKGTDNNSKEVGSGVYFYRLMTDSHEETGKMLLLK